MQKLLLLITASVLFLIGGRAFGQPKPFGSTPADYVPPAEQEIPAPESRPTTAPPILVSPTIALPATVLPPPPEISPNAEKWRYAWIGGQWWYRQPTNGWSYYADGRWVDYAPPGRTNAPPYVLPPPPLRRWWQVGVGRYYRSPFPPPAPVAPVAPYGDGPYPTGGY